MINLKQGDIVEGHRVIRPRVAEGASSVVHEAIDPEGRRCALKVLNIDTPEKFKAEFQNMVGMRHPNVAEAYHFGFYKGHFFYSAEFVDGYPFLRFCRPLKPEQMIPLFVQALEGLDFIHRRGLLHLDIKSENVLVLHNPNTPGAGPAAQAAGGCNPLVKIIDFGFSIPSEVYDGKFCGSPSYVAPEVALDDTGKIDARADLFSFGVLAYLSITGGEQPFNRFMAKGDIEKIRKIIKSESPPLPPSKFISGGMDSFWDTIIMRLIAKEPEERFYTNARSVLNAILTHKPDVFTGRRGNYLLPPRGKYVGQEPFFNEIKKLVEEGGSGVYCCEGGSGVGKTYLLECVRHLSELASDKWQVSEIHLPAALEDVDRWSQNLQHQIISDPRGLVVLVDDIDCPTPRGLGPGTGDWAAGVEKVSATIANLASFIRERQANPFLFETPKPIILIYTSCRHCERSEAFQRIRLKPFTREELTTYLKSTPAFRDKDMPKEWIDDLYNKTNGIQREVVEHLNEIDQNGLLFSLDGELILADMETNVGAGSHARLESGKPPASTTARLLRNYQALTPTEKAIVDLISVWGHHGLTRPLTYADISNFILSPMLSQNLKNLEEKGILSTQYEFTSSYFQAIIYNQISSEDRTAMHDQIAAYLKTDTMGIMLHRGYGSRHLESLRNLLSLGRRLLNDHGKAGLARVLHEHAFGLITGNGKYAKMKPYVGLLLLKDIYYCGDYERVKSLATEICEDLCNDDFFSRYWFLRLQVLVIQALLMEKQFNQAAELSEKLSKAAYESNLKVLWLLCNNYIARSMYEKSFASPEMASDLLERAGWLYERNLYEEKKLREHIRKRIFNNDLCVVMKAQGKITDAVALMTDKLAKVEKAGNLFERMECLLFAADALRLKKDFGSAEYYAKLAMETAEKAGSNRWLFYSYQYLVDIYHDSDDFDKAVDIAGRCLSASISLPSRLEYDMAMKQLWSKIGHCYKEKGEYDRALQFFEAVTRRLPNDIYAMSAEVGLGEVYYYKKDYQLALKHLSAAEKLLGSFPDKSHLNRINELRTAIESKNRAE